MSVELSPVANFLLTVSQSQQQLTQLQTAVANGATAQQTAEQAATLNDTTQNVVNAFNLLPAVDFNQAEPQGPSLLNNLVQSLQQQSQASNASQQQSAAQNLARIGVTLQPPLLSDATGGLSLDNEVLRTAFRSNQQATTDTLQNTLNTFSELATRFAEQLSAAGTSAAAALTARQQPGLTPADIAENARLDVARTALDQLAQNPFQETAADRLAAQRAGQEQRPDTQSLAPPSPIVNPLQASTAEVIAQQNAEAANATQQANAAPQANAAQQTAARQASDTQAQPANTSNTAQVNPSTTAQADAQAARQAADAAATAAAARQQSSASLSAVNAASTQAANQAATARSAADAAASASVANSANATPAQQANAAQAAASNLASANAAAAAAEAQAQAAQNAVESLAAQNAAANAAAQQASAAQAAATTPEAANAAAAIAAQQASAAQATAANLAAANAAAATAAQQAGAAQNAAAQAQAAQVQASQNAATQVAAVQASTQQNDPLRANPALASAIAAYNINNTGANTATAQAAAEAIPRVPAVEATARSRAIGSAP